MSTPCPPFVRRSLSRSLSRLEDVWKNEIHNEEYASKFMERLSKIYSQNEFTDVTLLVGEEKVSVNIQTERVHRRDASGGRREGKCKI